MRPPLPSLDIDRYVNWYYGFGMSLEELKGTSRDKLINRYSMAAWWLHLRYVHDEKNIKSKILSEVFLKEGKRLKDDTEKLKMYTREPLKSLYFLPDLSDWQMIDYFRENCLQQDIEAFEEEKSITPLPEIEFARQKLHEVETNLYPGWVEQAAAGKPLLMTSTTITQFAYDLGIIDFAKYIDNCIIELETPVDPIQIQPANAIATEPEAQIVIAPVQPVSPNAITWNGSSVELYTIFLDMLKNELITGTKADVARLICASFKNKDRKAFNFVNVQQKLNSDCQSKKRLDFKEFN